MKKNLLVTMVLLLTLLSNVPAQTRTITGTVTSAKDGESLPGVNIVVVDLMIGTITGIKGEYSIEVLADAQSLEFSYVGFESQTITIGNQSVINVALVLSTVALDEVMVTALGIERETKALGYAAQQMGEDELTAARELSVTRYLTGRVAGVQVTNTAAGTGGSANVTIRGNSSLSGTNQPLYVVDGVPIINQPKDRSGRGGIWGDNDYGDGIGDINPEDIESVNVLKGPNASALYGSRGANGVIVITTKSASKRKGATVELNSNFSIENINLYPKYQNKYATGYEGTNIYGSIVEVPAGSGQFYETMPSWHIDGWGPPLDGRRTVVNPWVYPGDEPSTITLLSQPKDNTRELYNTGFLNSNTLAISGGDGKTSGRLSFGNVYQKGIIGDHKVTKYNLSLSGNSQVSKWLRFDGRFNYIRTNGSQRPYLGYWWSNINLQLTTLGRYVPLDFLKEYYETTGEGGQWPGVHENPFFLLNEYKNSDYRDRMIGYASATAQFTDWLSLLARVGVDLHTEHHKETYPIGSKCYGCNRGRIILEMFHYRDLNADLMLTAKKQVSENFYGSFTMGACLLKQRRNTEHMDASDLKAPDVYSITNAQDLRPSSYLWEKEMQSVYFIGQLAYKNWLFLDVTGRNDWSSALGVAEYSFFYPSVGLSWIFSDALNISGNILSLGKARISWAQVGNDSDPYLTKHGYTSYTISYLGHGFASKSSTLQLYNLKNELTESWEVGGDLRFLQNRIGIDVTYYNGHTTNQILPIPVSVTSGYSSVIINAGKISNKGIEAILNLTPLSFSNSFRWDITFNYASNKNIVDELAPGIDRYQLVPPHTYYPNSVYANPGESYGNIYGYATKRSPSGRYIINSAGAYQKEASESVLGNITPDWIGGLNNSFSFKGFSLNVLIDFVQGGDLTSFTYYWQMKNGTGKFTEVGRRPRDTDDEGNQLPYITALDGVVEVLDENGNVISYEENTMKVDGQTIYAHRAWGGPTDWFVFDGSYISLREVMLSYRFQPSLLEKTPFYGITLSLVGRNLMYLENHLADYGVSPEAPPNTDSGYQGVEAIAIPNTRTIGLNVKLAF